MSGSKACRWLVSSLCLGMAMISMVGLTGCQVDVGGQTLPSPTYFSDDVQYFPPGPEFKLAREAAAMKAHAQEQALLEQP
jgi:hypothetical protein